MKMRIGLFLVMLHVVVLLAAPLGVYVFLRVPSASEYWALYKTYDRLGREGHRKVFKNVIKSQSALRATNGRGETILHEAVSHNEAVDLLLKHGADPNVPNKRHRQTPLHKAASYGACVNVLAMAKFGGNVDLQNKSGWTTLHYTVHENDCPIKPLLHFSKNIEIKDNRGQTALHYAAKRAYLSPVKALLAAGANVNTVDKFGNTPLLSAIRSGRTTRRSKETFLWEQKEVIRILREHAADGK